MLWIMGNGFEILLLVKCETRGRFCYGQINLLPRFLLTLLKFLKLIKHSTFNSIGLCIQKRKGLNFYVSNK